MAKLSKAHCCICCGPIQEIYRSPYFCAPCDRKRIEKISRQMDSIAKDFGIEVPDHDGQRRKT